MDINNITSENYQKQKEITDKIDSYFEIIAANGNHGLSHHEWLWKVYEFKELVLMGDKIVNYLFHRAIERGWNWAIITIILRYITPPIQKESHGNMLKIIRDLMNWYIDSDYYKNNDIYFGLVKYNK